MTCGFRASRRQRRPGLTSERHSRDQAYVGVRRALAGADNAARVARALLETLMRDLLERHTFETRRKRRKERLITQLLRQNGLLNDEQPADGVEHLQK